MQPTLFAMKNHNPKNTPKILSTSCALLAGALLCSRQAAAQAPISWSSVDPITTADATLEQTGTVLDAAAWGNNPTTVTLGDGTTINFSSATINANGGTAAADATPEQGTTNTAAFSGSGNANFDSVLSGYAFDGNNPVITLNNLIAGSQYSVQLFALDDRGGGLSARTEAFSDGLGNQTGTFALGANDYVIGTFTASGPTEAVDIVPVGQSQNNINALVVRTLSAVTTYSWSGTVSGTWDTSTQNFTGQAFANGAAAHFGDTDGNGAAVATTNVTVASGGVKPASVLFDNNTTSYTVNSSDANGISGSASVTVAGTGGVTLAGQHSYTGGTLVKAGSLTLQNNGLPAGTTAISNGAVLHYDTTPGNITQEIQTFTGSGTILISGGQSISFGTGNGNPINWNLSAGALIDIEGNTFAVLGTYANDHYDNNRSSLTVGSGSTVAFVEASPNLDALNGGGTVSAGYFGNSTINLGLANGSGNFSGVLQDNTGVSGTLALAKNGTGTQTLSGTNTYTGATTVNAGTLVVNGSITGNTTVNSGGTLAGTGTVGTVNVTSGGTVLPGTTGTLGVLTGSTVSLAGGATFSLQINTATNSTSELAINGDFDLSTNNDSILTITDLSPAAFLGSPLVFATYTGAWNNGLFTYDGSVIPNDGLLTVGGNTFELVYNYNNDSAALLAVPEPASLGMLAFGAVSILGFRRRVGRN